MVDTTARKITLGGRDYMLPMLPPKANRTVYPLCVKLNDLVKRTVMAGGNFAPTKEEYADVLECIGTALTFADPCLPLSEFEELAVKPQAHFDVLLIVRLQSGGWVIREKEGGEDTTPGEVTGEA